MGRVPLCPQNYLEVGVRVGIRQPGGPRALLVLEGPVKGLRDGAEVEDAHGGGGLAHQRFKVTGINECNSPGAWLSHPLCQFLMGDFVRMRRNVHRAGIPGGKEGAG